MKKSIKLIVGIGILSSSMLISNVVSADDLDKSSVNAVNTELNISLDENAKSSLDNLGNAEEVEVDSAEELKSKEVYETELKNVNQSILDLRNLKDAYIVNKTNLKNDIQKINEEVEITKNKISSLESSILTKTASIEKTKDELLKLYKEIEEMESEKIKREESFKGRVKSIKQNQEVGVIEVVLTSESFGDMINRFFSYKKIVSADNKAIEEYMDLLDKMDKAKTKTEELKSKLEKDLVDLEEKKSNLELEKEEYINLLKEKERQSMTLDEILADIDKDINTLNLSVTKLQINKNKATIIEELAKKVAKEREIAASKNLIYKYADLSESNEVFLKTTEEIELGKIFVTPTEGRFTSGFGPRVIFGKYDFHNGIDIANSIGTAILSSAEGEVIFTGVFGGYGNVVFIKHSIEDKNYVTVYGHLSLIGVKVGDVVTQGQTIGLLGNTGRSTGPHLHFEIQENTIVWNESKSVDPWKYLTSDSNDGIVREGYKEIDKIKQRIQGNSK